MLSLPNDPLFGECSHGRISRIIVWLSTCTSVAFRSMSMLLAENKRHVGEQSPPYNARYEAIHTHIEEPCLFPCMSIFFCPFFVSLCFLVKKKCILKKVSWFFRPSEKKKYNTYVQKSFVPARPRVHTYTPFQFHFFVVFCFLFFCPLFV